ncbi:hypothetical protein BDN72DRAFT_900693 [Pluteus cervinus]|uniref:Uncharacterized protein n=1 Tax=Pluteus cervinus TaxID=181527 RepID=A0ACD3AKQ4_9AGAR|nr:hypothetical protein BDN72DRAFT_900693 [Pluteus cervinus]
MPPSRDSSMLRSSASALVRYRPYSTTSRTDIQRWSGTVSAGRFEFSTSATMENPNPRSSQQTPSNQLDSICGRSATPSPLGPLPSYTSFRTLHNALDALDDWVYAAQAGHLLHPSVLDSYKRVMTVLLTQYFSRSETKEERQSNWQTLEHQIRCSICLETLKRPALLQCGHIFCERCISKAFREEFETNAMNKLSRLFTRTIARQIIQEFPVTNLPKFELFLRIFVTLRSPVFVQDMMTYWCPCCRQEVQSIPKLFPPLFGVSTIMQSPVEEDHYIRNLFLDPFTFRSFTL